MKRASEELILGQVPKLAVGQRITLAKRGPARLAASLLKGENCQIIQAVLDNPYLTEAVLLPVLNRPDCSPRNSRCNCHPCKVGAFVMTFDSRC